MNFVNDAENAEIVRVWSQFDASRFHAIGTAATKSKVKVKFICIAHFMYKTIQSALHKIKALQQGAEKALEICKRI